jgi:NhaP-type Na+/H+ or K+/H+ antiporter
VIIDLIVSGDADLSRPFVALGTQLGEGIGLGVVAAAVLLPLMPPLQRSPHSYTIFLAAMLALYAITESVDGSGAMAVLTSSLLLGNAASIVPKLFPGARGQVFIPSETALLMQDQMSFLIKSFFFSDWPDVSNRPRQIALAGVAAVFLFLFRIPAVMLATKGIGFERRICGC